MKVELTNEEALVLFEWICNNSKKNGLFRDKSEQLVLWNIECQLEKELTEPHLDNYITALAEARDSVKRTHGGE